MRFVGVKTTEQQSIMMLHPVRRILMRQRTQLRKDRSSGESRRSIARANWTSPPEAAYAKRSISASASAISGISGEGEKPSSAGASTARASAGRAVD